MTETPFYKTRMGRHYYEKTLPDLVKAIDRLADCGLRESAQRLVEAVDDLLDTEIVPDSERTREAFAAVRLRAKAVRRSFGAR